MPDLKVYKATDVITNLSSGEEYFMEVGSSGDVVYKVASFTLEPGEPSFSCIAKFTSDDRLFPKELYLLSPWISMMRDKEFTVWQYNIFDAEEAYRLLAEGKVLRCMADSTFYFSRTIDDPVHHVTTEIVFTFDSNGDVMQTCLLEDFVIMYSSCKFEEVEYAT